MEEKKANGENGETKEIDDHYSPSVRMLNIPKNAHGSSGGLGFHLTRSKWDPYPWVYSISIYNYSLNHTFNK